MSQNQGEGTLKVGWASVDTTPPHTVPLSGQFHMRLSEGVRDPLSATVMAMASTSPDGKPVRVVMVSCDLVSVSQELIEAVRERSCALRPELEPTDIILNATHTHTAPEIRVSKATWNVGMRPADLGIETEVMSPAEYNAFLVERIAGAIVQACNNCQPAGIGFGLGHATIGYNRRICYTTGETKMYGGVNKTEFSHIEAGVDPSINVLCVWNQEKKLTGIVVNLACPSQVSELEFQVSADYWHETRLALREKLGQDVFILPQCSAAGDVVPGKSWRTVPEWRAQERMYQHHGISQRDDIARRITEAVVPIIEGIGREIDWSPTLAHCAQTLALPLRKLTEQDVRDAEAEADTHRLKLESLKSELQANPKLRENPRWYCPLTHAYRIILRNQGVCDRYERQKRDPHQPTEAHAIRLGEVAFATNPFEYYVDYGLGIKARSPAIQTFLIQLAGPGTYLPTARAVAGKSYGAMPVSTPIGPEGGQQLADWTVQSLIDLWPEFSGAKP